MCAFYEWTRIRGTYAPGGLGMRVMHLRVPPVHRSASSTPSPRVRAASNHPRPRTRITHAHITHVSQKRRYRVAKNHVLLLIGTEPNVPTRYTSTTYTRTHDIVYWLCIDFRSIFDFFALLNASGGKGTRHTVRHRGSRSENTSGGARRYRKTKNATHARQQCQYVCGAKLALYNVWFSALADVRKRFCKIRQNPLTSPFFQFFWQSNH